MRATVRHGKPSSEVAGNAARLQTTDCESFNQGIIMFKRKLLADLYSEQEGRMSGHGGGGKSSSGGMTPFFCKTCGKTVPKNKVKPSVDVCSKCRARK